MLTLITGLLGGIWVRIGATLLKWGGILLVVLGMAFAVYRLIIIGERGKQASKALEVSRERKNLDKKVDAMPDSSVRDLLRAQQSRFKRQL